MIKILFFGFVCVSVANADSLSNNFERFFNDKIYEQNRITTNFEYTRNLDDPTMTYDTNEWILFNEYDSEVHNVLTDDGYNLTIHRLRSQKRSEKNHNTPVFLQHGLLSSSMDWVLAGQDKSLGFLLADQGYDVWLGNTRGNRYSRGHKYLDTLSGKYWDFSWHEMGVSDLPAMIDFVLEKTSHKKLFYVGHSQGTTSFFVMTSTRPEYNQKIIHMIGLAPLVFCNHMPNKIFRTLAALDLKNDVAKIKDLIGVNQVAPTIRFYEHWATVICDNPWINRICSNFMFMFTGFNQNEFDQTLMGRILHNFPAGASVKQLLHYAKLINTGGFHNYDNDENYNLTKVTTPVSLFYSENDLLSSMKDSQILINELPNSSNNQLVENKYFNHCDYLWANDAVEMVYTKVFKLLNRYLS